jgi:rubrerythrin
VNIPPTKQLVKSDNLKSSTISTPLIEEEKKRSGSISKQKKNESKVPAVIKTKPKTTKASVLKNYEKTTKEISKKNEQKVKEIKEVIQSTSTASNFEDDQEEDVWICPVCSVAYVENGPDMVKTIA